MLLSFLPLLDKHVARLRQPSHHASITLARSELNLGQSLDIMQATSSAEGAQRRRFFFSRLLQFSHTRMLQDEENEKKGAAAAANENATGDCRPHLLSRRDYKYQA